MVSYEVGKDKLNTFSEIKSLRCLSKTERTIYVL